MKKITLLSAIPIVILLASTALATCPNSPVSFGQSVVGTCDQDASITAGCIHRVAHFTNTTSLPMTFDGVGIGGAAGASFGLGDQLSTYHPCIALLNASGPGTPGVLAPGHTCSSAVIGGATQVGRFQGSVNLLFGLNTILSIKLFVTGIEPSA